MSTKVAQSEVKVQREFTELENENIKRVERQLFKVTKMGDLIPKVAGKGNVFLPITDKFGIYKTTGGQCLGTVGKVFVPMQPSEFLENIKETVKDFGAKLDLETLTFTEYCGGSRIEFRIEIEPIRFQNARQRAKNSGKTLKELTDKDEDITKLFLTFTTSYNGSKPNVISLFTERLVCTNGMVANKLEGTLRGKNTMNGKLNILSYGEEVAKIINGTKDFKQKMIELDMIKLNKQQIEDLKLKIFGFNAETENIKKEKMKNPTKSKNELLLEKIDESIKMEFHRTGQTAFGLLQGVTYYTNHVANVKEGKQKQKYSNSEYIRFNQGVKINNKAQELLFGLIEPKNRKKELVLAN
jgi:hypothetical protein